MSEISVSLYFGIKMKMLDMDWMRGWKELGDMVWPRKCGVCGDFLETVCLRGMSGGYAVDLFLELEGEPG